MAEWFPRCGGSSSRNLLKCFPCVNAQMTSSTLFDPQMTSSVPPGHMIASGENFSDFSPQQADINDNRNSSDEQSSSLATVEECKGIDERLFPFEWLPDHLKLTVFGFFTPQELCIKISLVCKSWHTLAFHPRLWTVVDLRLNTVSNRWDVKSLLKKVSSSLQNLSFYVREEPLNCPEVIVDGIVPHLPALEVLDLGFNRGLELCVVDFFVDQCPNLRCLNLEGLDSLINDKSIQVICQGWRDLEEICISHCEHVSDDGVALLARQMHRIRMLNIDGISKITDLLIDIYLPLMSAKCDQHLAVTSLYRFSTPSIVPQASCAVKELSVHQHRSLERIYLDGAELTDLSVFMLTDCTQLKLLAISFCESLTDSTLGYVRQMECLEHLHLRKGTEFTANALKHMFDEGAFPRMQYLSLAECSEFNDECTQNLVTCCPSLRSLCLSWCWSITERGLDLIIRQLPDMECLCLEGLKMLEGHIFKEAALQCTSAKSHPNLDQDPNLGQSREKHSNLNQNLQTTQKCDSNTDTDSNLDQQLKHTPIADTNPLVSFESAETASGEILNQLVYLDLRTCNNIVDTLLHELVRRKRDLMIINYYGEILDYESLYNRCPTGKDERWTDRDRVKNVTSKIRGGCCMTAL